MWYFTEFFQTQKMFPTSLDKIVILTWILLVKSSQIFLCELNFLRTYSLRITSYLSLSEYHGNTKFTRLHLQVPSIRWKSSFDNEYNSKFKNPAFKRKKSRSALTTFITRDKVWYKTKYFYQLMKVTQNSIL